MCVQVIVSRITINFIYNKNFKNPFRRIKTLNSCHFFIILRLKNYTIEYRFRILTFHRSLFTFSGRWVNTSLFFCFFFISYSIIVVNNYFQSIHTSSSFIEYLNEYESCIALRVCSSVSFSIIPENLFCLMSSFKK